MICSVRDRRELPPSPIRPAATGNYGLFLLGEQMVYRDGGPGGPGAVALRAFIYAPQQRINRLPYFASAGATYRGLVPGRDRDTAAFALYYGGFSRDLAGQTYELVSSGRTPSPSPVADRAAGPPVRINPVAGRASQRRRRRAQLAVEF